MLGCILRKKVSTLYLFTDIREYKQMPRQFAQRGLWVVHSRGLVHTNVFIVHCESSYPNLYY